MAQSWTQLCEVSFFRFRCDIISDLDVKLSVTEMNILVTSICDSPSHMWNALLVTSLDYFFYYFQISQNQNFCEIVCSLVTVLQLEILTCPSSTYSQKKCHLTFSVWIIQRDSGLWQGDRLNCYLQKLQHG